MLGRELAMNAPTDTDAGPASLLELDAKSVELDLWPVFSKRMILHLGQLTTDLYLTHTPLFPLSHFPSLVLIHFKLP